MRKNTFRFGRLVLLTLFLNCSQSPGSCFALQDIDACAVARSLGSHRSGYYRFDGSGRLNVGFSERFANTNTQFFDDESIRAEIEIVDSQQTAYAKIIAEWQSDWADTIKRYRQAYRKERQSPETIQRMIAQSDEKSLTKLRELLLPHQLAIINELQFRCLFRTHGLTNLLKNEALCESLELSNAERTELVNGLRELVENQVPRRVATAIADSIKTLWKPLPPAQQAAFKEKWGHLFEGRRSVTIEELLIWLDPTSYAWIQQDGSAIELFLLQPNYETGAAGNLIQQPPHQFNNPDLTVFQRFWMDGQFADWMQFTEAERSAISEAVKDSNRASQLQIELHSSQPSADTKPRVPFAVRQAQVEAEAHQIEQQALADIKEVLGPSGWARVKEYAAKTNLACAGPLYDLLEGDLNQQWKLTATQTDQIRAAAKLANDELIRSSNEIEQFLIDDLASKLDEPSQQKFRKLFGQPVKNAPANIGLLRLWIY